MAAFKAECRYCKAAGVDARISTPSGWKRHFSLRHNGFTKAEAEEAGVETAPGEVIKGMSGFRNLEEVRAAAPETEGAANLSPGASGQRQRTPRLSKEDQDKQALQAEFDRLRPILIKKWERRLRIPYSVWSRLANDPKIQLSDNEATEGAEMHVELMQAMGWLRAGKVEAIADLILWHGATILGRSELGSQLLSQFSMSQPEQPVPINKEKKDQPWKPDR